MEREKVLSVGPPGPGASIYLPGQLWPGHALTSWFPFVLCLVCGPGTHGVLLTFRRRHPTRFQSLDFSPSCLFPVKRNSSSLFCLQFSVDYI